MWVIFLRWGANLAFRRHAERPTSRFPAFQSFLKVPNDLKLLIFRSERSDPLTHCSAFARSLEAFPCTEVIVVGDAMPSPLNGVSRTLSTPIRYALFTATFRFALISCEKCHQSSQRHVVAWAHSRWGGVSIANSVGFPRELERASQLRTKLAHTIPLKKCRWG